MGRVYDFCSPGGYFRVILVSMNAPSNVVMVVLWVLGGLALFLYGIDMMSVALRKSAGNILRRGMRVVTRTRFHGLLAGALVTGVLQSSSVTTVMVVGFITAGLIGFEQSIGLILGANIGAPLILQFTAFRVDGIALPVIGIGFLINLLARRNIVRELGLAAMGFGILFFGLVIMKFAVSGYADVIRGWLEMCVSNGFAGKFLAFGVAVAVTLVIQSSSATVVMIQAFAMQGAFTHVELAIPVIIGADIGTCITAILASLKAPRSAKRAALAHLVFNIVGAFITVGLYNYYVEYIPRTASALPRQIANCHLAIKFVNVFIFLPFAGLFAKLISLILPGRDAVSAAPEFLKYEDVSNPERALDNVRKEIKRVFGICAEMIRDSVNAFFSRDGKSQHFVLQREEVVDDLSKGIAGYVIEVSEGVLPSRLADRPSLLMEVMSDVERIGDHAENIVETSQAFARQNVQVSEDAVAELRQLLELAMEIAQGVLTLFDSPDMPEVQRVLEMRKAFNVQAWGMIKRHEQRLAEGKCSVIAGIVFVDIITNLQRVVNHFRNITANLGNHPVQLDRVEV